MQFRRLRLRPGGYALGDKKQPSPIGARAHVANGTAKLVQIVGDRSVAARGAPPSDIDFSERAIEPCGRRTGQQVGVPARQKTQEDAITRAQRPPGRRGEMRGAAAIVKWVIRLTKCALPELLVRLRPGRESQLQYRQTCLSGHGNQSFDARRERLATRGSVRSARACSMRCW